MIQTRNYRDIKISDYNYDLPEEKIARYPLEERSGSRLLICREGSISERRFADIPELLPPDSYLVFNNTRVIHARLLFRKETGAPVEIFCMKPHDPADYQLAFQKKGTSVWECMVGNAKRWKSGPLRMVTILNGNSVILYAEQTGRMGNLYLIRFSWDQQFTFGEVVEYSGNIPIPPYLNRESEAGDDVRYQTVYAKIDGSVAAPTAGLHFTDQVFSELKDRNIRIGELTLHVGAGTFQPVKAETIAGHIMHDEFISVSRNFIEELKHSSGKIITVGTTSLRSLESLYWLGVRLHNNPEMEIPAEIGQWDPYSSPCEITANSSLEAVIKFLDKTGQDHVDFSTRLMIIPGYRFRMAEGLITNFHQPQSTLLLLIAAFIGPVWRDAYLYALNNGFRFLSYGDSNLYLR